MKKQGFSLASRGLLGGFLFALLAVSAQAQSTIDMPVLKGLAPVTVLANTPRGREALAANYIVTGGIQNGEIRQATLMPFADQQQLALRDVFITDGNLAELSDGLGTTLGSAYLARAHYIDQKHYTSISPAVTNVIGYAEQLTGDNAHAGKYFFANETTDGKTPVSEEAKKILTDIGGHPDMFGTSYHLPAGSPGGDAYGNSRPFQTEHHVLWFVGPDYFNVPSGNDVYNRGPVMDLSDSPSFPSGHTTYGYTGSLILAILVPERYQEMIVRGAEYGNSRIMVGAHYTMDVLGGRTLAMYGVAHLLANDKDYLGHSFKGLPAITDFQAAMKAARADMVTALESGCGKKIAVCAKEDTGRLSSASANEAFYSSTQTYDLGVVYPENAGKTEDVAKLAPEAGYLLTAAFPSLTLAQANQILTETEGPGGGFLDNGSAFGVYSRLNLYAAAGRAAQMTGVAH